MSRSSGQGWPSTGQNTSGCASQPGHTARRILDEHGTDEPVQRAPRRDTARLRRLRLPGPDLDSINVARLHQAVPSGDFSIARVAQALNTTTAHVMYLPSRPPVDWSPPRFRRTQHTATRIGQWRTWYERDHLSLQDIADREGSSPPEQVPGHS
ncbi:hypothetical protein ABZ769_26720 [Streptomyces olivoreticuli]